MEKHFLLHSDLAKELYTFACTLPIVDYHNHLPLDDIRENRRFDNVYDLWIAPDPYKHRAMRMCGVPERLITGDEPRHKKFSAFCAVYPKLLGNPLYYWLAMEAQWLIGKSVALSAENADDIYHAMNRRLAEQPLTVDDLFTRFRVEKTCPCASLADDIGWMRKSAVCSPSLRGDDAVNVTAEFVKKLSGVSGTAITDLAAYKEAVRQRLDAFYVCGCQFADHALDNGFDYIADDGKNAGRFAEVLGGKPADSQLVSYLLTFLGHEYALRGMTLQLHIGAERFTSSRLRAAAGAAGGFAGIGSPVNVAALTRFLDTLERTGRLPKTILFTLNPADNAVMSVLSGSYAEDGTAGLITQGPAWWWCDHKHGIQTMLEDTAAFGLLRNFVGMTTDSRSFLSLCRHDYFRRVLCDFLGDKVTAGEYPADIGLLKQYVYDMCYGNAAACFERKGFDEISK